MPSPGRGSAKPPGDDGPAVMNRAHFIKMAYGDIGWLRALGSEFFAEIRGLLPGWLARFEAGDFSGLREELHRSKGGASLFGVERLVAVMVAWEQPMVLETQGFDVAAFMHELEVAEQAVAGMMEPAR